MIPNTSLPRLVFKITNKPNAKTLLDYANSKGLKVDQDNYNRAIGEAISINTSKKYNVAGNKNLDYYIRKRKGTPINLNKDTIKQGFDLIDKLAPTPVVNKVVTKEPIKAVNKKVVSKIAAKKEVTKPVAKVVSKVTKTTTPVATKAIKSTANSVAPALLKAITDGIAKAKAVKKGLAYYSVLKSGSSYVIVTSSAAEKSTSENLGNLKDLKEKYNL